MDRLTNSDLIDRLEPDLREAFEERAAIAEFDGQQARAQAESMALLEVLRRHPGAFLGVTVMRIEIEGDDRCALVTDRNAVRLRLICKAERNLADLASIVADRFSGVAVLAPLP